MKRRKKPRLWLTRIFHQYPTIKFKFIETSESPEIIPEKVIIIVNEGIEADSLIFKCPCNCHADIHLNLLKDSNPSWRYHISKKNKISISPSILRTVGCQSHFFIKNGQVIWL